jgi:hypothetical protein
VALLNDDELGTFMRELHATSNDVLVDTFASWSVELDRVHESVKRATYKEIRERCQARANDVEQEWTLIRSELMLRLSSRAEQ